MTGRPSSNIGRRKLYTARGIRRVACARCGAPSTQQWSICALGNRWFGVCDACDIHLNASALELMRIPGKRSIMARYRRAVAARRGDD